MNPPRWTDEEIAEAARLWAKGLSLIRMSIALDRTERAIDQMVRRNRPRFPPRPAGKPKRRVQPVEDRRTYVEPPPRALPTLTADRVRRTTISGAKITLPRVTFIDGPYRQAAE